MLNAYTPPIAVALGCVAPQLSPHEAAPLTQQSLPNGAMRGLGLSDIAVASERASRANFLQLRRKPHGDPIRR